MKLLQQNLHNVVERSCDFKSKILGLFFKKNKTMVNYDIVCLCTSIPIDRCLDFITGLLQNDRILFSICLLSISLIIKSS